MTGTLRSSLAKPLTLWRSGPGRYLALPLALFFGAWLLASIAHFEAPSRTDLSLPWGAISNEVGFFYTLGLALAVGLIWISSRLLQDLQSEASIGKSIGTLRVGRWARTIAVVSIVLILILIPTQSAFQQQVLDTPYPKGGGSSTTLNPFKVLNDSRGIGGLIENVVISKQAGAGEFALWFGLSAAYCAYMGYIGAARMGLKPDEWTKLRRHLVPILATASVFSVIVGILVFALGGAAQVFSIRYAGVGASLFVALISVILGVLARDPESRTLSRFSLYLNGLIAMVFGALYGSLLFDLVQDPILFGAHSFVTLMGPAFFAFLTMIFFGLVTLALMDDKTRIGKWIRVTKIGGAPD